MCTAGGSDCYSTPTGPAGCGINGQIWDFDLAAPAGSSIRSSINNFTHCLSVVPTAPPSGIALQIWAKPLLLGEVAVLAFNRYEGNLVANITMNMLGWPEDATATFYDLWAHASLGKFTGVISVTVAPHDVVMLRATRQ